MTCKIVNVHRAMCNLANSSGSFISYRLAQIKNAQQVSLEAGNSPQMVLAHYRRLVTETQATEWFGIRAAERLEEPRKRGTPNREECVRRPASRPNENLPSQRGIVSG